jgi:hypothetical protein
VSCRCSTSGLFGSVVPICGGVVVGGRNDCAVHVVGVVASEEFGYATELPVLPPFDGECRGFVVAQ